MRKYVFVPRPAIPRCPVLPRSGLHIRLRMGIYMYIDVRMWLCIGVYMYMDARGAGQNGLVGEKLHFAMTFGLECKVKLNGAS